MNLYVPVPSVGDVCVVLTNKDTCHAPNVEKDYYGVHGFRVGEKVKVMEIIGTSPNGVISQPAIRCRSMDRDAYEQTIYAQDLDYPTVEIIHEKV